MRGLPAAAPACLNAHRKVLPMRRIFSFGFCFSQPLAEGLA
jgi:hypothetical protein